MHCDCHRRPPARILPQTRQNQSDPDEELEPLELDEFDEELEGLTAGEGGGSGAAGGYDVQASVRGGRAPTAVSRSSIVFSCVFCFGGPRLFCFLVCVLCLRLFCFLCFVVLDRRQASCLILSNNAWPKRTMFACVFRSQPSQRPRFQAIKRSLPSCDAAASRLGAPHVLAVQASHLEAVRRWGQPKPRSPYLGCICIAAMRGGSAGTASRARRGSWTWRPPP